VKVLYDQEDRALSALTLTDFLDGQKELALDLLRVQVFAMRLLRREP
jgi:hypothetical protein